MTTAQSHAFNDKYKTLAQLGSEMERYIQQDPGKRGLAFWACRGNLFPAAVSLAGGGHMLISTGFYILSAGTIETDGPPGAIILASALIKLGKRVTILTDTRAGNIIKVAMDSIGCTAQLLTFDTGERINASTIIQPGTTHCTALERPGLAADGFHYNFRGVSISPYIARLDDVFTTCSDQGIITVGIGDGGNELGMGNVSQSVDRSLNPYRVYSCKIPSDYCICAGVSNWAGYALAALLSKLSGKNLMPDFSAFSALIENIVASGAVDGVTGKREATVDSLPRDWEDGIYRQMYQIAESPDNSS